MLLDDSNGFTNMTRIAPYPLRMQPESREYLENEAERSMRSLQQEILYRLDKFQQIENLMKASSSDKEDIYMLIANALRAAKSSEEKNKEIESLKEKNKELMAAIKVVESDRFITINKNAEVIEKAISNIINALPPVPEPVPRPNKKPT